jgi:uncharacterized protein YkwD
MLEQLDPHGTRSRADCWRGLLLLAFLALLARADAAGLPASPQATDGVLDAANRVRREGCMQHPGQAASLRAVTRLEAAAQQLAQGRSLDAALAAADYPATVAAAMRVRVPARSGEANDEVLERNLAQRFCAQLASPEFQEIGIASDGRDAWLVLATPFAPPGPQQAPAMLARVLELVNIDRARGRRCDGTAFPPAAPLVRTAALEHAAALHARDLVALGKLSHRGSDGSRASDRIRSEDHAWSLVAENLAAGPTSAEEVVAGWFGSASHCANLMNARFTDMGVAYDVSSAGAGEIYWVQVLGAARGVRDEHRP